MSEQSEDVALRSTQRRMAQRNAYYVEMRKYDDPTNPSTSPYDVELPVTSSDAVMLPNGTSATDAINAANTTATAAKTAATTAQTTANNAMPKAGGTFTGNVAAQSSNNSTGGYVRNIQVNNAANTAAVATNYLLFLR